MTLAEGLPELDSAYESLGALGRGASALVLRARERATGREVALKLLSAPPSDRARAARFLREGQLAASLSHPGVVRVHAVGRFRGKLCLAFELVEGARPLDVAARERPLRGRIELVRDAAEALGAAHAAGLVHRDVKGENLLVDAAGRVRVTDFGVATGADLERLTRTGALVGTPLYMAPEQLRGGELSPATDVWALGVLLYELCCGAPPFSDQDGLLGLMRAIDAGLERAPRRLAPELPPQLEAVIVRALSADPAERPPEGAALAAELAGWLRGEPAAAGASGARWGPRALGLALAFSAGAALLAWRLIPSAPPPSPLAASARPSAPRAPREPSPRSAEPAPFASERTWEPRPRYEPRELLELRYVQPSSEFLLALEAVRMTWTSGTGPASQLGELLLRGGGVGADREAALSWLRWGASCGGQTSLEGLLVHLSPGEERLRWALRGWWRHSNRRAAHELARTILAPESEAAWRQAALGALGVNAGSTHARRRFELLCEPARNHAWRRIPLLSRREAFRLVLLLAEEGWQLEQAARVLRLLVGTRPERLAPALRELDQRPTLRAAAFAARLRAEVLADRPGAARGLRRALGASRPGAPGRAVAEEQLVLLALLDPDPQTQAHARLVAQQNPSGAGRRLLGLCHELACGGPVDLDQARRCYEDALNRVREPRLRVDLCRRLLRLEFDLGDHAAAWARYEQLAEAEQREVLVVGLESALRQEPSRGRAARELRALAKAGVASAMGLLAHELRRGTNLPKDKEGAWRWAERGVLEGDPEARYVRGSMLRFGEGRAPDPSRARRDLERAAAGGNADAMREVGVMFLQGKGGPRQRQLGLDFLRQGAEAQEHSARTSLCEALLAGSPAERAEAERWLTLAVRRGSHGAQHALARLRQRSDPAGALRLAQEAAQGNTPEAWLLLGDFYRQGVGTRPDLAAARRCYESAQQQGSVEAGLRLRELPR